jgi:prolyl 4-hydroxylase
MQHNMVSTNYPWLPHNVDPSLPVPDDYKDMTIQPLGNKQEQYEEYIQGCMDHYTGNPGRCLSNEAERITMSLRQPKGMYNYTELGYTKIRAPDEVMRLLKEYWEANKDNQKVEPWPSGYVMLRTST